MANFKVKLCLTAFLVSVVAPLYAGNVLSGLGSGLKAIVGSDEPSERFNRREKRKKLINDLFQDLTGVGSIGERGLIYRQDDPVYPLSGWLDKKSTLELRNLPWYSPSYWFSKGNTLHCKIQSESGRHRSVKSCLGSLMCMLANGVPITPSERIQEDGRTGELTISDSISLPTGQCLRLSCHRMGETRISLVPDYTFWAKTTLAAITVATCSILWWRNS